MSGGGGGGYDSNDWRPVSTIKPTGDQGKDGGGGGEGGNPCLFTEVTNLASPNMSVVGGLSTGSILVLTLQQTPSRVVAMSGGNIAGSITSARLADFIQCMASGQGYEAKVIQISGGAVTVEIYPI